MKQFYERFYVQELIFSLNQTVARSDYIPVQGFRDDVVLPDQ